MLKNFTAFQMTSGLRTGSSFVQLDFLALQKHVLKAYRLTSIVRLILISQVAGER